MENDAQPWIRALRHSQDRLASIVRPLTAEQLGQPSYHSWTIAQVLSHMGSGAEISQGRLDAIVAGAKPPAPETWQSIWDAWNARGPEKQARDGVDASERLVRRYESLTDAQLNGIQLNLFGMELDAAGLVSLSLGEHAVHTWDIAVALDSTAGLSPEAAHLLIDTIPRLVHFVGKPQGKPFVLHVHTTHPDRDYKLLVGDAVDLVAWNDDVVGGELRIPAEAFLRLIYGRLDTSVTPEVELAGSVTLDDLRAVFPGI